MPTSRSTAWASRAVGDARAIVSACLLGYRCRYDGGAAPSAACARLAGRLCAAPVCPEGAGGLAVPRPPAEIRGGTVVLRTGEDVGAAFATGARKTLEQMRAYGCRLAILKSKSPSCGAGRVYDGTFTGRLVRGDGIAARLLAEEGAVVVTDELVEFCEPSVEHPVALVLGSGLGAIAERVKVVRRIPYRDIEGFPEAAIPVAGHRFEVLVGALGVTPVVVYPGRIHMYQGYSEVEVTALVRHAARLGCRDIVFTCASGGVGADVPAGVVGLITDHINLTGRNPLAHPEVASRFDSPFVPMAGAYSTYLGELARISAQELGIDLHEGVYAGLLGPTYETAAEIRALEVLGASYVGMSTVCEVIMARVLGMQSLGLTLVTNAAGGSDLSHEEVLEESRKAGEKLTDLVAATLGKLGAKEE